MRRGKQQPAPAITCQIPPLPPHPTQLHVLSAHPAPCWPHSKQQLAHTVIHDTCGSTGREIIHSKVAFMDWPRRECLKTNRIFFSLLLQIRHSVIISLLNLSFWPPLVKMKQCTRAMCRVSFHGNQSKNKPQIFILIDGKTKSGELRVGYHHGSSLKCLGIAGVGVKCGCETGRGSVQVGLHAGIER